MKVELWFGLRLVTEYFNEMKHFKVLQSDGLEDKDRQFSLTLVTLHPFITIRASSCSFSCSSSSASVQEEGNVLFQSLLYFIDLKLVLQHLSNKTFIYFLFFVRSSWFSIHTINVLVFQHVCSLNCFCIFCAILANQNVQLIKG